MTSLVLAGLLGWAGALCLAAAMNRHQRDLFGRALPASQALAARAAGWLLIGVTAVILMLQWGWALGLTLWLSYVPLAGLAGVLLITWSARRGGLHLSRIPPSSSAAARPQTESTES